MMILPLALSLLVQWARIPGAESYHVYVGLESLRAGNPPLVVYQTPRRKFRVRGLTGGTRYFFAVKGICPNGTQTPFSNEVSYVPVKSRVSSDLHIDPDEP